KGGWKNDPQNKFVAAGRNEKENEAYNYLRKLANYRKTSTALQSGKLIQYVPEDGVYVFFRDSPMQKVMVLYNGNEKEQAIKLNRFDEVLNGYSSATEITTGQKLSKLDAVKIPAKTAWIFELEK
ncbi:MAG: cyclomaltodextrinase C-terminal domain-containing protein, partial [Mucilaginibacter polytrichastri]|nr:cyclomaltodextrinase C-terminal domain-containing protein [Mucilaginibacter polytrichastri]